ncbi:cmgc/cdk/pitslre protein kinase [Aulographum hederae CBS 113979]|uniref:cyclin-dependent kinase n=1 Tax=Aulographum hederae CBS 113979 TaxID=1176131 RepID=A0A6G1GN36_9PEZI|nr:cmgc/cdk/pitslre protein kinase [Aulographum hederae CBS 113979]
MAGSSRWASSAADKAEEARRKLEKEEKKKAKLEKQRKLEEAEELRQNEAAAARDTAAGIGSNGDEEASGRPAKRRRLSTDNNATSDEASQRPRKLLRFAAPGWGPCRSVDNYEPLNRIEEGSYGLVSRGRELATGDIVALKKLKMDNLADGFPITALREIQTLRASAGQTHIVALREVVLGTDPINDVYLVMDFLEHDLKTLQEEMSEPFLPSEVKTLLLQLVSAMDFLHERWILHRDLKTSNILMNNRGQLKIADFGMARYVSEPPPKNLTQLVVTLWYRAPELLLGAEQYDDKIDMWSVGCIFGELLKKEPLFMGKNEVDELSKIFTLCGPPTLHSWPTFRRLPNARHIQFPPTPPNLTPTEVKSMTTPSPLPLRTHFPLLTNSGTALLSALLSLDPLTRPSASEVLKHPYFEEIPRPKHTSMFPTFPSKGAMERRRRWSPNAPVRGEAVDFGKEVDGGKVDFAGIFGGNSEAGGAGFALRMG